MKVCFVGAHGVGKSTLAREVFSRLWDETFSLVENTSITFAERSGVAPYDKHYEDMLIMHRIITFNGLEDFISDRSLVDPLAYQRYKCGNNSSFITDLCHRYSQELTLFYIPPGIPLVSDGDHRSADIIYQKNIDERICHLLQKSFYKELYKVDVLELESRTEFVYDIIKKGVAQ